MLLIVLQEIAQYEEGEKQLRRQQQQQQQDDEAGNASTHRQTDSVLEASLVIAFESEAPSGATNGSTASAATSSNVYGLAPKEALVALLAHRAPGLFVELRTRMMQTNGTTNPNGHNGTNGNNDINGTNGTTGNNDDGTTNNNANNNNNNNGTNNDGTTVTKGEVRAALMEVGAYWSTPAKPAARELQVREIGLYDTCWWYSLCNFQYRQQYENTCWYNFEC